MMKEMDKPNNTKEHCRMTTDESLEQAKESLGRINITQGRKPREPQFEYRYMDGVLGYVDV